MSSYAGGRSINILFAIVIFLSAFLLFLLEPLTARRLIPWFGGSAAVWSTCLVFYQAALLAGYFYAQKLSRVRRGNLQAMLHIALLVITISLLPIGPGEKWARTSTAHPAWLIFAMLTATIGLAFVALAATSPLLQAWLARGGRREPYALFAVSNFASLAALIAYPALMEPHLGVERQRLLWSALYAGFVLLCGIAAWGSRGATQETERAKQVRAVRWEWFALSACGSMLLLSVTNHLDVNVAAVPLIWILPLAVYLLSFVVTFGAYSFYRRGIWLRLLAFALGVLGYAIYNINSTVPIQLSLAIFLAGLFFCCVFCHGELNRLRPPAEHLTSFYLQIAGGGALGAFLIGIAAPNIFGGVYEVSLTLVLTSALALVSSWPGREWQVRVLWMGVCVCMIAVAVANFQAYHADTLSLRRSFYGSLRVIQTAHAGPDQQRILFHGTIEHGAQFVQPPGRERPTTYYGPESGAGIVLRECFPKAKRVGVVGLGAGTLAAYGNAGDDFTFYEINSQIVDMAESLFFYTRESKARIHIKVGDGRVLLEREKAPPFNVLVLDAFAGDAIPVHLLTKQAFALYRQHLAPGGVVAFHTSNDFLDLAPVVDRLARDAGFSAVLVHNHADLDDAVLPADWVLVSRNPEVLQNASVLAESKPISTIEGRLWTDDYSNILSVFKTPQLRR